MTPDTKKFPAINRYAFCLTAEETCENLMSAMRKLAKKSGELFHQVGDGGNECHTNRCK